jgi:hypothetical protein
MVFILVCVEFSRGETQFTQVRNYVGVPETELSRALRPYCNTKGRCLNIKVYVTPCFRKFVSPAFVHLFGIRSVTDANAMEQSASREAGTALNISLS